MVGPKRTKLEDRMRGSAVFGLLLLVMFLGGQAVAWTPDGIPVCTASQDQRYPDLITDGLGGVIVTWQDYRSGNRDVYAQRVNSLGEVQWLTNGVPVCVETNTQEDPMIISDGVNGCIITWEDGRGSDYNIYAQRVEHNGLYAWTANGVRICGASRGQYSPRIVSDGFGGAIIVWRDNRHFTSSRPDIYAQLVNPVGVIQWDQDGVPVCTADRSQEEVQIASDGLGGAITTWQDDRFGISYDIFAQRLSSSGAGRWTSNGISISAALRDQRYPAITSDGSGGAIIAWQDWRSGVEFDIYAQRVDSLGDTLWAFDGVPVCTAWENQTQPRIVSDGLSGAIILWQDYRENSLGDIYAQRINSTGMPEWTTDGIPLCSADSMQADPEIVSDGCGGAIITWTDYRNDTLGDIYAQQVSLAGIVGWPSNGVPVCTAVGHQWGQAITGDGAHGAVVTWTHMRSGVGDIYAQHVDSLGQTSVEEKAQFSLGWTVSRLHAFPNPFAYYTSFKGYENDTLTIYDLSGQKIDQHPGNKIGKGLPSGVYFVSAPDGKSCKIVKVK